MQWMFGIHYWSINALCSIKNFISYVIENMQELWERALNDLVELLEKWIEVIPPYLVDLFNRYAMYGIFKEWFYVIMCLLGIILPILRFKKYKDDDEWMDSPAPIFFFVVFIISFIFIFVFSINLIEAIFIPEVYVIHDLQWCSTCRW